MDVIDIENQYGIKFCERQQLVIEKGKGTFVWDDTGARYLDFTSGWGVTCLGHSHPVVVEAISKQASRLMQNPNSGFTYSPVRAQLLERLRNVLPGNLEKMYFANSGAEANDAALKLARKITGKPNVISTNGSFHGRTYNSLSVSGGTSNTDRYLPRSGHTRFVKYGDIDELVSALDSDTAAVIVEPVQGEGGVRIPPSNYLSNISRICRLRRVLFIVDEVQTGFGRTGRFFALEHDTGSVTPDILTMGKGIAAGFPFAGFAVTQAVSGAIEPGDHGGTYCGNPLGCAVSLAVVKFIQDAQIVEKVITSGQHLLGGLERLALKFPLLVREARGRGLLTALELCHQDMVSSITDACRLRGLLVTPTRGGIIRLIPDLLVSRDHIDEALRILEQVFSNIEVQVAADS